MATSATDQVTLLSNVETLITLTVQILQAKNITLAEKVIELTQKNTLIDQQNALISNFTNDDVLVMDNNRRLRTAIDALTAAVTPNAVPPAP